MEYKKKRHFSEETDTIYSNKKEKDHNILWSVASLRGIEPLTSP